MITVQGHKFIKEDKEIGWVDKDQVYDKDGRHVGYFEHEVVYKKNGERIGYLQGGYFYDEGDLKMELEKLRTVVAGGDLSDLARGAALVLLKD